MAKKTKIALVIKVLTRCLTVLAVLSVYFGSLNVAGAEAARTGEQVFCPLQKTWVRKIPASIPTQKQREPLKDLCAHDEKKTEFLSALSESLRLTRATPNTEETIKLFFAYFTEGKPALKHFVSSQNVPEPQYISAARVEKSANNPRLDLARNANKVFVPAQILFAFDLPDKNFISPYLPELKNISRRIKPRAPPLYV